CPYSDNALGHEEGDGDKKAAKDEEPEFRQDAGEPAFSGVYQKRADDRADNGSAPAYGGPDHHFNGIAGIKFAGIDDADLRHVKGAGHTRHHGGDGEGQELDGFRAVSEKTQAAFGIAHADHEFSVF